MKKKSERCPSCGQGLFMEKMDGSKICVNCGCVVREPSSPSHPSPKAPQGGSETCPQCGSSAHYDPQSGCYVCPVCGMRFQKAAPQKQPEPSSNYGRSSELAEAPKKELSGREIFKIAKDQTVEIASRFASNPGGYSAGTGFFLNKNLVLTNAHVVMLNVYESGPKEAAETITINYKDSDEIRAQLLAVNPAEDMAILAVEQPARSVAKIAKKMPETGEVIYAVGNSAGAGMCILEGIVADQLRQVDGNSFMMVSANIVGGNSGGPIFSTAGEVVGVVTLGSKTAVAMNYAIPIPRIEAFISAVEDKLRIKIL